MQSLIQVIEQRQKAMSDLYDYNNAPETLKKAFQQQGVTEKAMGYADPWGEQGLFSWFGYAGPFYRDHLEALQKSLNSMKSAGFAHQRDLDYFRRGMNYWKQYDEKLVSLFREKVAIYAEEGLEQDQKMRLQEQISEIEGRCQPSPDYYKCKQQADAEAQPLQERVGKLEAQMKAGDERVKPLDDSISDIGKNARLFSAIKHDVERGNGETTDMDSFLGD